MNHSRKASASLQESSGAERVLHSYLEMQHRAGPLCPLLAHLGIRLPSRKGNVMLGKTFVWEEISRERLNRELLDANAPRSWGNNCFHPGVGGSGQCRASIQLTVPATHWDPE